MSVSERFTIDGLGRLRSVVAAAARAKGLSAADCAALVTAAHELATNAIRHGGGVGWLAMGTSADGPRIEVSDAGPGLPDDADVVTLPASEAVDGRGLWLVHHLVPHFELRTDPSGVTATIIAGQTARTAVNSIV